MHVALEQGESRSATRSDVGVPFKENVWSRLLFNRIVARSAEMWPLLPPTTLPSIVPSVVSVHHGKLSRIGVGIEEGFLLAAMLLRWTQPPRSLRSAMAVQLWWSVT